VSVLAQSVASVGLKSILLATDFSDASEAALPYAAALSQLCGSEIHVTHILPDVTFLRPGVPHPAAIGSIYEDSHSNAQEKMRRLSRRLKNYPHKTYVRHGEIPRAVSDLVREQDIDLIIAGTHGRTGLGRLILGSVAEEILRQAPCPVLTVGPNVIGSSLRSGARREPGAAPEPVEIRDIVYATDFRQNTEAPVGVAVSLASKFHARLGLLHVIDDYGERVHELDRALDRLSRLVPADAELAHAPEPLAQFGMPADCILQTAAERETDLIVLGARSVQGSLKVLTHLGTTVAHRIIVGANCPVLTVRC
jgi:nucleotide-binding universal stress UspA family protein